jgi:hypothetical protein
VEQLDEFYLCYPVNMNLVDISHLAHTVRTMFAEFLAWQPKKYTLYWIPGNSYLRTEKASMPRVYRKPKDSTQSGYPRRNFVEATGPSFLVCTVVLGYCGSDGPEVGRILINQESLPFLEFRELLCIFFSFFYARCLQYYRLYY